MHKSVEEFSIKTVEIGGFASALIALHLPFGGNCRSIVGQHVECDGIALTYDTNIFFNSNDTHLMSTLVKRGDEHAKILRGVTASCLINAPRYLYQELDRYRIGCECLGSNSTMHQQGKGMSEDELVEMKEALPEGTMQERVWVFSYQTLRRIYFQRRNHRLPQWRKFCEWIETLPFAKELITIDGNVDRDK